VLPSRVCAHTAFGGLRGSSLSLSLAIQDIAFVLYYIVFFSWYREVWGIYVLRPLARHFGVRKPAKLDRFAEQGYAVIYFTGSGVLGLASVSCQFRMTRKLTCPFSPLAK
jgi:hypothetical protein